MEGHSTDDATSRHLDSEESDLVERLRRGDEEAFAHIIDLYHGQLRRIARLYVDTDELAEEVLQETWIAVFKGIDRFSGKSALKTWIFSILLNRARSIGRKESRSVTFSELVAHATGRDEPSVDPDQFLGPDHPQWPGHWANPPQRWNRDPEGDLMRKEVLGVVEKALDELPDSYRQIILMRDVYGFSSAEVCNTMEISETNQRVLLHRARARIRRALDMHLGGGETSAPNGS